MGVQPLERTAITIGACIVRGRRAFVRAVVPAGYIPAYPDGAAYITYANDERDEVPLFAVTMSREADKHGISR